MATLKEVIAFLVKAAIKEHMSSAQQLELPAVHDTQVAKLEDLMRHHDWHYQYSDDPQVYRAGARSARAIEDLAKTLPQEEVAALVAKYKPRQA